VPGANLSEAPEEASPLALVGVAGRRREREEPGRGAVPVGLSEMPRFVPHDGQYWLASPTAAEQDGQAETKSSVATIRRYDSWRREIPAFRSPWLCGRVPAAEIQPSVHGHTPSD